MSRSKTVRIKFSERIIEAIDMLVARGLYPSRSAFIRTAVRELLKKEIERRAIASHTLPAVSDSPV